MLKSYLRSGFRSLVNRRMHSGLNIIGLAIGMASAWLILQYVMFETSYNDFHENRDQIYRITYSKEKAGVESFHTVLTYTGIGRLMVEQFPEVINFVRLAPASTITSRALIRHEDILFEEEDVYYTDPSFFDIFSFELIRGDKGSALKDQFTAVISETLAKKYFGDTDPIGQAIRKGRDENYLITGVMRDAPQNSHVSPNLLLSHSTLSATMYQGWTEDNLTRFHGHLYILTTPGADPDRLAEKFPEFVMNFIGGEELAKQNVVLKLAIMPLGDIHLHSSIEHEAEINGDRQTVDYMAIIALMILIIALVNYVNMSTARAMERSKEIGVRKVIGARKLSLVGQFMTESFIINFFAVATSLIIVLASQPFLAELGAAKLEQYDIFQRSWFWLAVCGTWIAASLLSGIYPSLVMSSYHPATVLKGRLHTNRQGSLLRKALVVFQFASSACLIIGTIIIYSQITFMRNQKLGMNIDDKLVLKGPMVVDSTYTSRFEALKNSLLQLPAVKGVSASHSIPGKEYNSATWFTRMDNPETDSKFCYINYIDDDFAENYELEFLAGRNFAPTDQRNIIINEAALNLFEFENAERAIGTSIAIGDQITPETQTWMITGIVGDFNQQSLRNEISPVIMFRNESASNFYSVQLTSMRGGVAGITRTIDEIRQNWVKHFPGNPFNYHFLRPSFDAQYKNEVIFGKLLSIFAGLTILVAILGLIGLSSYTIQQRTKELGIRKALGSGSFGIVALLSKDIFRPILIANLIAWPVCWYIFSGWLDGFAFKTEMQAWPFLFSLFIVVIVAASAITFQVAKAATANPVQALKYE